MTASWRSLRRSTFPSLNVKLREATAMIIWNLLNFASSYKHSDNSLSIIRHSQGNAVSHGRTSTNILIILPFLSHSLDSGNDGKISKEEFLSDDVKNILQKVQI